MKTQAELEQRLVVLVDRINKAEKMSNEYRLSLLEKEFETICWVLGLDSTDEFFKLNQ